MSKRWSKNKREIVQIPTPNAVKQYNFGMGGTDRMDQIINAFRVAIRGKKWWWSIFTWLLDANLQNAWLIFKMRGVDVSQKEFKREVAMTYLKSYKCTPRSRGRKFMRLPGANNARYDEIRHFVILVPDNKEDAQEVDADP